MQRKLQGVKQDNSTGSFNIPLTARYNSNNIYCRRDTCIAKYNIVVQNEDSMEDQKPTT